MLSNRAQIDLAFFSGVFLSILGFATFSWLSLLHGGFEISGGVPVTLIENEVLFAGLFLSAGTFGYMMFGQRTGERKLPSQALGIDFMFLAGLFLVWDGFNWNYCNGICYAFPLDSRITFTFVGLVLLVESVYLWHREKKAKREGLRWEVLSSAWLGILAVALFVSPGGGIILPFQLYAVNFVIAAMSIVGLAFGIWGLRREKAKIAFPLFGYRGEPKLATRKFILGSLIVILLGIGLLSNGAVNAYLLPSCSWSCGSNVPTINLVDGACSSTFSTCYFAVTNPLKATNLTSVRITGSPNNTLIENLSPNFEVPAQTSYYNMTVPFPGNVPIRSIINYELDFANGDSITGQLTVQ